MSSSGLSFVQPLDIATGMLNMKVTGQRQVGDEVNLERAMGAHVRFGGHFVQVQLSLHELYKI